MTSQDIYNLLHCCKHISSSIQEFNDVLDTFTERYALCSLANDEGSLYANHPLAVLFLLSNRFEFTPAIQRLLQVIVQKLELVNSNITDNYILSGNRLDLVRERIVKAFKGVDQYPCSMVEISLLMKVLCTYASTVQLSPRNACEILSSLSNKRCDNDHMLKFLSKIRVDMTAADTRCMIAIPPHMACSALGGLSATCCGSEEINMLLYEICHIINRDRGALNGKDIAIAISGIRNMNLNCAAVNNVLALLTTSMRDGKNIQFRSLEIIGIISSVNTMYQRKAEETSSPDFELPKEIKRILQVLAQRTMPSRQQFFGKKEVITQLKNMSILQLFKCGEVNGLRVSLRRKGML